MSGSFPLAERATRQAETREKILAAAREVFTEFGYDGAMIRAIVTKSGTSTGAVFGHFKDKDDLFAQAMGRPQPYERIFGWLRGMAAAEGPHGDNARQLLVDVYGVDA